MGEIGRKIASRVAAFETEVGYFSRSRHDAPYRYLTSLEALAEWCSVLMIAVPRRRGNPSRRRCQDPAKARQGGLCRQHLARGSVIDQEALVAALAEESIAGRVSTSTRRSRTRRTR